jgi:hypothetical protein
MTRCFVAILAVLGASGALGCDKPAAGLTQWTVADHDHQFEPKTFSRRQATPPSNHVPPPVTASVRSPLIEVTWMRQCSTCHGRVGAGDGPQAMMYKPRDLRESVWQDSVSDEQIADVIRKGKNKMPSFSSLPDSVLTGIVQEIRRMGHRGRSAARAPGEDGAEQTEGEAPENAAAAEAAGASGAAAGAAAGSGSGAAPSAAGKK